MSSKNSRKRLITVGAIALLVAGISTGGALITTQSTVFDNVFKTEAEDSDAVGLKVSGAPINASYSGSLDGEVESAYFTVENLSDSKRAKFDVNTRLQPGGKNAEDLAAALSTRVGHAGTTIATGTLKDMKVAAADQVTLQPGETTTVRVDVLVEDSAAFLALGLGDDAVTKVDFLFNSIFAS